MGSADWTKGLVSVEVKGLAGTLVEVKVMVGVRGMRK